MKEEKGITVICVLHDLNLASQYCDRILLLNKGMLAGFSSPGSVLTKQNIEHLFQASVLVDTTLVPNTPTIVPISRRFS